MPETLFASDVHLNAAHPEVTERFFEFLQQRAARADALYLLGDVFEYWIGDDVASELSQRFAEHMTALSAAGVRCAFLHGNRDFLLGQSFANACGMQLLPAQQVIQLGVHKVLLLHGDELCTDDAAYQAIRATIRTPVWQDEFLDKTVQQRIDFADQARAASQSHTRAAADEIMDVNEAAVLQQFKQHNVDLMIHGHTHRPAMHRHGDALRVVLGDWHNQASVLSWRDGRLNLYMH